MQQCSMPDLAQGFFMHLLGMLSLGMLSNRPSSNRCRMLHLALPASFVLSFGLLGVSASDAALGSNFTNFTVTYADSMSETFEATPARWNSWHPKPCAVGSGWRCACPQPAGPLYPSVAASLAWAPGHTRAAAVGAVGVRRTSAKRCHLSCFP